MDNTVYPFLTQTLFPGGEGVKRASNRASHSMGLLGLLLMALGLASSKALQNTGMAFMLLAMVLERGIVWPVLKRDSLSKAIGLWLIYLLLRTVLAAWEFPELAADQFDNAREMSRPFLIILVAWWVGGTPRSVLNLYLVSFSGLLLAIAYRVDWLNLRVFLNARIGLGMNTQHLGLITVTAIIGWLVFATDLWGRQRILRTYGIKVLLWLMFLALLLFILLRSQARAAWAAFILWGFFALLYCLRKFFRYPRLPYSRKNILAYAAAVLLAVGIVSSQLNAVATRLSQEKGTVERLLAGNVSEMPSTSLGIRFYLWKLGLHRWSERKIFGWGPGTTAFLIEKSDMPDVVKSCCSHELHNSFLEIPLRTGIIGLFFFAGATFVILRSIFRSVQRREITEKAAFFSVSVLFVFMVTNLSEAYVELQIGWFFFALFGGSVYSFKLWEAPARAVKDSGNIQIIEPPGEGDVVSSNKSRQRKSRYRVLLITNGCHITETQFVRRLYEAGIDLVFITDPFYQDLDKLMKWKIPTVQLALRSHFDRAAIRTIRQMIRSEGFDIVHTSANRPLTNSLWASYGTGVKLIAYRGAIGHVHRWDPSSWLKWLNPRVDRVVCVSNAVREDLLSAGVKAEKLLTIYKG
ncbi:MAG: O-antigen ligase family protein, partial [Nitrospiria bacterium]